MTRLKKIQFKIYVWPKEQSMIEDLAKAYMSYKEQPTVINGIIFKGQRLIIPTAVRKIIIQKLHQLN